MTGFSKPKSAIQNPQWPASTRTCRCLSSVDSPILYVARGECGCPLYRRRPPGTFSRRALPMLKVILPDGSSKEFPSSVPVKEVAAAIGPRLAKAALAAEVDGNTVGLDYRL